MVRDPFLRMASTFALDSFYGGASTSSKGRDSALSDTEWPLLNSVSTRRKGARPSVSPNKGKKGGKKGRSNVKGKSVDNVNMSQDSENPLNDSVLGDVLNKGVTNDSALSVGNVLSNTLLNENMGVEDSLSNSGLMEALNANNHMSVDDVNTSQETVELNVSVIEPLEPHDSENCVNQTPIKKRKRGGMASYCASDSSSWEDCSDDEFKVDDPDYVDDDDEDTPLKKC